MHRALFAHPWYTLSVMTLVVLGVGHRALFIQQDNSPDTFFAADRQARQTYLEMVDTFGGDEYVLVQLRGARSDRSEDLAAVARLARAVRKIPGVTGVLSPAQLGLELDEEARELTPQRQAQVRGELRAIELYRRIGIYQPGTRSRASALGVAAQVVMRGPRARTQLTDALERVVGPFKTLGYRPLVAGLATANAAIDRETRRSLGLFLPLVLLLILTIGMLLFRSVRAVLAMFLPVGGAVLLGIAGLELFGETLNLVTGIIPPLVLAVSFAGAIHLVSHYATCCTEERQLSTATSNRDCDHPDAAIRRTIRDKLVPTAFAYGTTALGFGSLALSDVHAVRVMGLATAGALLCALVLVTIGTPALLLILRPRLESPPHRRQLLGRMARLSLRHRWVVFGGAALAVTFAVTGGLRLRSSTNGMDLLSPDAPERVAYQQLEREGLGLGNVDIWLRLKLPDQNALLKAAPRLQAMAQQLRRQAPMVTGALGVHDLLRIINFRITGRAEVPASLAGIELLLDEPHRRELDRQLRAFWHPQRGLKLTLLSLTGDAQTLERQKRAVRAIAARLFPRTPVAISGHFAMLIGTPGQLMTTLAESLGATVGVVSLLFLLFFRAPWLVASGMLVNLLPVGLVLGGMGWVGIPLDVATVMTGSVVFGMAVDDTFHYLYHRRKSGSVIQAAHIAGQGIVATSIVIAGGFSVLVLSGFTPVVRFGLLTTLAVVTALVVDAVLLPALVGHRSEICPRPAVKPHEEKTCTV